jgi:CotH protein.
MKVIWNGDGQRNNITDPPNHYNGKIGIELRGSSSQSFPKKGYAVETRDSAGENLNVELMGFPAENDWVFNATYNDKSLMRDVLVYDAARKTGRYASRSRYFELVVNGDYKGLYILFEKIKRDKNRVAIKGMEITDTSGVALTGGYIVKIDKLDGEDIGG